MIDVMEHWDLGEDFDALGDLGGDEMMFGALEGISRESAATWFASNATAGGTHVASFIRSNLNAEMQKAKKKGGGLDHDAAWALDYDLKRPEIKATATVPAWLMTQIAARVQQLLGGPIAPPPMDNKGALVDLQKHKRNSEFPWVWVIGGVAVLGLGGFFWWRGRGRRPAPAAVMQGLSFNQRRRRHRR
jgi:hypothetical protein